MGTAAISILEASLADAEQELARVKDANAETIDAGRRAQRLVDQVQARRNELADGIRDLKKAAEHRQRPVADPFKADE